MEKLNAVVLTAEPGDIMAVCQLAENLDQFDFFPGIHTPEEYGRYMIQQSGHFEYDENLEGFSSPKRGLPKAERRESGYGSNEKSGPENPPWQRSCRSSPRTLDRQG